MTLAGCGAPADGADPTVGAAVPGAAWADCLTGLAAGPRADECAAWRLGRTEGRLAGLAAGEAEARRVTRDGYRARRTVALALVVATLALGGALMGAALRRRLGRRKSRRYPEHALERIQAEAEAIRALGAGDPLVAHVVTRVEAALSELLAAAAGLAERAGRLDEQAQSATATAHRDGLCDELDRALARVERLHVQVTVWQEQVSTSEGAQGAVGVAIEKAMEDLRGAIREIGT
ncbi:MAG: hypothetical protein H6744_08485 [Deltaproteobacteria bacterium]|nr:hypothetical protein [Deltaproteobacteria bacterium]MCB9786714.1 hypothetical protein [Deltaproteobacteria bacterium]